MDTLQLPRRQAAALDVLRGAGVNASARKHDIDPGQVSRYVRYARKDPHAHIEELEREIEFWKLVADTIDSGYNS